MSKADDKALKAARDAVKERYSKTFQDLADSDAVPKWVEEAAMNHCDNVACLHGSWQTGYDAFLAGAQLILDRLKATEKGDASAAPPLLSGFPEHAFEQGRESVRREVLGDE